MSLRLIQDVQGLKCELPPGKYTELRELIQQAVDGFGYDVTAVGRVDRPSFHVQKRGQIAGSEVYGNGWVSLEDHTAIISGFERADGAMLEALRKAVSEWAGRGGYCLIV